MFASRRKERASDAQQSVTAQSAQNADTSTAHSALASQASAQMGASSQKEQLSSSDQAVLEMMSRKAHAQYPQSKDVDEHGMQHAQPAPVHNSAVYRQGQEGAQYATQGEGDTGQYTQGVVDEDEDGDGVEDDDEDDDDLFKFVPPEQSAGPSGGVTYAGVEPNGGQIHSREPHTATTDNSNATADITSLPLVAYPPHQLSQHDQPAPPHLLAGNTGQNQHYEPAPSFPQHSERAEESYQELQASAMPLEEPFTEAQLVAKNYQNRSAASSKTPAIPALEESTGVATPAQSSKYPHEVSESAHNATGPQKRRQPYKYPGSPIYRTSPHTERLATPATESAHTMAELTGSPVRHRQETGWTGKTASYPPEYGLHPNDRNNADEDKLARRPSHDEADHLREAGDVGLDMHGHRYSRHLVELGNAAGIIGSFDASREGSQSVRRRRLSKHSDEMGNSSSGQDRDTPGDFDKEDYNEPQSPESRKDFMYTAGYPTAHGGDSKSAIGIESRDGTFRYTSSARYGTGMTNDFTRGMADPPGTGLQDEDGKTAFQQFELEDEEDSPYPEVRASVSNIDDPEMPCLTFRAMFTGILFTIIGGSLNFFFSIRLPAPIITPLTVQIITYPFGKFLAYVLPTTTHRTPRFLCRLGAPEDWSLNPGPFNIKEHAIIVMMVNISTAPSYALAFTLTLDRFYETPKGPAFDFLALITTNIIGFSFAGICRRYLVWPASLVWPQNLVICTLFNTFHAEDDDGSDGSLTRFRFFTLVFAAAAIWYILPGFLFTALSVFSFVCWIAPRSKVANQLFGVVTGLGMSAITLDWSMIAYTGSPLIVPWWAEVNVFVGFVALYWILTPILYYTNTWNFAYMPISAKGNFDRYGAFYNVTQVITPQTTIDEAGYQAYSMLFMSTTYATVYALSFTLSTAAIVHTLLYNGKDIFHKFKSAKSEQEDVHSKLMRNYPEVPDWWYWAVFAVFTALGIVAIEIFDTQLPVWCFLLSLLIAAAYVLPGGYIYAVTSQMITVNLVAEVVPGYVLPGKPIANILFKTFSVQCLQSGLYFVQDLKLGHYMKIPPRATFMVQVIATLISCCAQVGVKRALEGLVPDLCAPDQKALLVCPTSAVTYEASIIWGVIGPNRFFGKDSLYQPLLYFMLLGALLPIPFFFYTRKYPRSWLRYVNIPVLLNGASYIPPASGINYSSWFIVGFIFQYLLRRFRFRWWSKFCFIASAALEGGTVLSALVIFLTLQLPGNGRLQPSWWGNDVYKDTNDWNGVPYKTPPPEGFGPSRWS